MNKETFFTYKKALGDSMKSTLIHSKAVGRPLQPYCATDVTHVIAIHHESGYFADESKNGDAKETIADVYDFMERYPEAILTMESLTEQLFCTLVACGTRFTFTIPSIIGEITDYMIEAKMKEWVRSKLFLRDGEVLECRVLDLFKKGVITWEEVKLAHVGNCEL